MLMSLINILNNIGAKWDPSGTLDVNNIHWGKNITLVGNNLKTTLNKIN